MAGHSVYLNGSVGNAPRLSVLDRGFSTLGYGMKGFSPQQIQDNDHTYADFEQNRFQLVQAWNNVYKGQLAATNAGRSKSQYLGRIITPFRAVNNAGDILSRKYYSS